VAGPGPAGDGRRHVAVVPGPVITVNRHDLESTPVRRKPEGPAELMTFGEYRARYGREPYIDPARVNPFD
jgi:hypothetical protein